MDWKFQRNFKLGKNTEFDAEFESVEKFGKKFYPKKFSGPKLELSHTIPTKTWKTTRLLITFYIGTFYVKTFLATSTSTDSKSNAHETAPKTKNLF